MHDHFNIINIFLAGGLRRHWPPGPQAALPPGRRGKTADPGSAVFRQWFLHVSAERSGRAQWVPAHSYHPTPRQRCVQRGSANFTKTTCEVSFFFTLLENKKKKLGHAFPHSVDFMDLNVYLVSVAKAYVWCNIFQNIFFLFTQKPPRYIFNHL